MTGREISEKIKNSERKTPVKAYISASEKPNMPNCKVFGSSVFFVAFGAWEDMERYLSERADKIRDIEVEVASRKTALCQADLLSVDARVEYGAHIREGAVIGKGSVIMHGAVINSGAVIGDGTMVDMNAVVGSCAVIGKNSHIGACVVIAGVLEPPSALPTRIGDGVLVGAGAVVLEGICIGDNAVIGAGAVVTHDIPSGAVALGVPAKVVKSRDDIGEKADINGDLR